MTVFGFLIILLIISLWKMFFFTENPEWVANDQHHSQLHDMNEYDEANFPKQDWIQAH